MRKISDRVKGFITGILLFPTPRVNKNCLQGAFEYIFIIILFSHDLLKYMLNIL